MQPDPILNTWYVISNIIAPDERITLQAGQEKYALVFTNSVVANKFMNAMRDPNLELLVLQTWVFKETFLTTLSLIAVTRVLFDYTEGQHHALSAPLELLQSHCRTQIGRLPKA